MKKWIFTDKNENVIWETSSQEYADEFVRLLEQRGIYYVITVQTT